jgi:hypothetical protein
MLKLSKCDPVMPPDLKSRRSVIVRGIDSYISECDVEDLVTELCEKNPWLTVAHLFKFPSGRALKITCKSQEAASRCLKEGLRLFNLSVPSWQLSADVYDQVTFCYRCYAINSHTVRDCDKPSDYVICSTCSSADHTHKNCEANIKKCINCAEAHHTLAYSCAKRKEAIKQDKEQQVRQKQGATYNQAAKKFGSPFDNRELPFDNRELNTNLTKAFMCMIYASNSGAKDPMSFEVNLNELLQRNNLPQLLIGGLPPLKPMIPTAVIGSSTITTAARNSVPGDGCDDAVLESSDFRSLSDTCPPSTLAELGQPSASTPIDVSDESTELLSADPRYPSLPNPGVPGTTLANDKAPINYESGKVKNTRPRKCVIYCKRGIGPISGSNVMSYLDKDYIFIDHFCESHSKCVQYIRVNMSVGNKSCIKINELTEKAYVTKKTQSSMPPKLTRDGPSNAGS